jgi:hypothetical protein
VSAGKGNDIRFRLTIRHPFAANTVPTPEDVYLHGRYHTVAAHIASITLYFPLQIALQWSTMSPVFSVQWHLELRNRDFRRRDSSHSVRDIGSRLSAPTFSETTMLSKRPNMPEDLAMQS